MFGVYLFCLIVGGLLIAVTLITGGDDAAEADLEIDGDLDVDVDGDLDVDSDGPDMDEAVEGLRFLSLRNVIFFMAIFGLTGTLLSWIGVFQIFVLPIAITLGVGAAMMQHRVLNYLLGSQVGEATQINSLVGQKARVVIDVSRENRGKIRLDSQGQTIQLLADISETAAKDHFEAGEHVLVVEVDHQIALVAEENYI